MSLLAESEFVKRIGGPKKVSLLRGEEEREGRLQRWELGIRLRSF